MIENLNEFVSVVGLLSIPLSLSIYGIFKILKRRRINRKVKEGKYYPEW